MAAALGKDKFFKPNTYSYRSPNEGSLQCAGTDANRNWGYHWNEGGTSDNACSDTYHGDSAFSEVEVANVRDYLLARPGQFVFFHDIHSYSQLVLLPWGFTMTEAPGYDRLFAMASAATDALFAVHQKDYTVGCLPCVLYIASGSSVDWAKGVAGIDNAVSMELRDTGDAGFLLPPSEILPTGEEVWAFHVSFARQILAGEPSA
jgi:hypothetical protein